MFAAAERVSFRPPFGDILPTSSYPPMRYPSPLPSIRVGRSRHLSGLVVLACVCVAALAGCRDRVVEPEPVAGYSREAGPQRVPQKKPKRGTGPSKALLGSATVAFGTADVASGLTAQQLAEQLVGSGVVVSSAAFTGAPVAGGTFEGGAAIGFDSGTILSSGDVANVVGPNATPATTAENGTPGDAQLQALAGGPTADAAVLTFDFQATADSVYFEYVFASEEYTEFVGSEFDDAFAFFVNGTNCATIGGQRVSVNTVNDGTNAAHFRNNDVRPGPIDTEMDGLTTVQLCAAAVLEGVNTVKLVIADVGDDAYDSNVFIKAGSFSTVPPTTNQAQVNVSGPSGGVASITVTATNVATGEFYLDLTDAQGDALFALPDGDYTFSARRMSVSDPDQLYIWPPAQGFVDPLAASLPGYTPVIYLNGGSALLNPANLRLAVASPLSLSGGQSVEIELEFGLLGATVECTLLDTDGNTFQLGDDAQAYLMTPAGTEPGLPPVFDPGGKIPDNLTQRAIALGVVTIETGESSGDCSLPGAPPGTQVVETGPVELGSETVVYRSAVTVTGTGAVDIDLAPTPLLSHTYYLFDPLGDNGRSPRDIGELITAGWGTTTTLQPTDEFVVASGFSGAGHYTLEIWTTGDPGTSLGMPELTVTARCEAKRCELQPTGPARNGVTVSGVIVERRGVKKGTITWSVRIQGIPEEGSVWFRIGNGQRRTDFTDTAQPLGAGTFEVRKLDGGGNTWIVAGAD